MSRWLVYLEKLFKLSDEEMGVLMDELDGESLAIDEAKKYWMNVEKKRVQEEINKWKNEIDEAWRKERRIDYYRSVYAWCNQREREIGALAENLLGKVGRVFERNYVMEQLAEIEKKKKSCISAVDGIKGIRKNGITVDDEMIARAREFPLENLVEVNEGGFAVCINHTDSKPSMFCKGNYAHCFSCGWSADVIGVYQKLHDCNFIEAVKSLTSNH